MTGPANRFLFASAPDSWGVLDYPGPSWNQSYEKMLDEMVEAGYTGTELGPYGYFPTDPDDLGAQLEKRKLKLLGSFVPVKMGDLDAEKEVIERIRKVGPTELEDVITIHDPMYYTRDWSARFVYKLRNDVRIEDYVCGEPHRDISSVAGVRRP